MLWDFDPLQEWQHFGDNKQAFAFGYVEGSQLFKVGNTYHLSVASGGTEHTTYATGVMTSKKPLEEYRYSQSNPIGYGIDANYPSGLYPNAGHGSFVLDGSGRLMFFYTHVIGYEQGFERRLGMDICDVTREGIVSCRLSNTPRLAPGKAVSGKDDVGLYNLSTLTSAYWASSYAPGRCRTTRGIEHYPHGGNRPTRTLRLRTSWDLQTPTTSPLRRSTGRSSGTRSQRRTP